MFSLICAWINAWVNNREAGDLRRHHAHDVIVMRLDFGLKIYIYIMGVRCVFLDKLVVLQQNLAVLSWEIIPHMMTSSNGSIFPVNSPHKSQWRVPLMFSLICARINGRVNNGDSGDLRRYRAHYDVAVMNGLWSHNLSLEMYCSNAKNNCQIRWTFCTCGDDSAAMTGTKWWPDSIIRIIIRTKQFFMRSWSLLLGGM